LLKFYYGPDPSTNTGPNQWNFIGAKRDFAGGATGIVGTFNGSGNVVLYATGSKTSQGAAPTNLITLPDTNPYNMNFSLGNPTELKNIATTGEAFRGIAFVPTPAAPTVANVQVNDGSIQRSEVRSITVTFSGPVTFAGGNATSAFQLTHVQNSNNVILGTAVSTNAAGQTVVTLTFSDANASTEVDPISELNGGVASLADGRYQLTVFSADVAGTNSGLALAGGGANGNYVSPTDTYQGNGLHLYRLFGDVNGDGVDDATDVGQLKSTFNRNNTDPLFLSFLDADNSGAVDAQDIGQFKLRFNVNVFG